MIRAEGLLKFLLRLSGVLMLLALVAVFMPGAWMALTHEWLSLGTFPEAPIAQYLARSLSAFYAIFGGLFLLASADVRRYAGLITYFAVVMLVFGTVMTVIDVVIGLPLYWSLGEFLSAVPLGVVILVLQRRVR